MPVTEKGRIAGTFLMVTGIATLGVISGTLASALRPTSSSGATSPGAVSGGTGAGAEAVAAELRAVREQLVSIERQLGGERPVTDR